MSFERWIKYLSKNLEMLERERNKDTKMSDKKDIAKARHAGKIAKRALRKV